jgi:adenosylcobinamide-GDP ribazoletransferase
VIRLLVHELRLFGVALQFLTRIPVPARTGFDPAWLNQSARHFPAVGLVVGAVGAGVLGLAGLWWPWPVAVGLSMLATVLLTGGFHEDGLADTCDGLGGAVDRERALAIMKDSRIGTYGALGLAAALGLKAAALLALGWPAAAAALMLAHAASRAAAVVVMARLAYAGDPAHAKAKPLVEALPPWSAAIACAWVLATGAALVAFQPLWAGAVALALTGAGVASLAAVPWLRRRLGGYTGDTLGAVQQVAEVLALLGWLATLHR